MESRLLPMDSFCFWLCFRPIWSLPCAKHRPLHVFTGYQLPRLQHQRHGRTQQPAKVVRPASLKTMGRKASILRSTAWCLGQCHTRLQALLPHSSHPGEKFCCAHGPSSNVFSCAAMVQTVKTPVVLRISAEVNVVSTSTNAESV